MGGVRCADCGLLAVHNYKTSELIEVDETMRRTWTLPITPNEKILDGQWPVCSALAAKLMNEVMDGAEGPIGETLTINKAQVVNVLEKARQCQKFTPYIPTFSPKEHKEMMHADGLKRMEKEAKASDRRWHIVTLVISIIVAAFVGYAFSFLPRVSAPQPIIINMPDGSRKTDPPKEP